MSGAAAWGRPAERQEARTHLDVGGARHLFGQFAHGELAGVADVDGVVHVDLGVRALLDVHQTNHALDQVIDETERARLLARAVDVSSSPRSACTMKFETTRPSFSSMRGP
jgi:hypothetical protein